MAQETIRNIKDAELKAQQIVKDAEAEKVSILNKARQDGQRAIDELAGAANEAAQKAVREVELTRDAVMVKAEKRAGAVIASFSKNIEAKREKAIDFVISEIS